MLSARSNLVAIAALTASLAAGCGSTSGSNSPAQPSATPGPAASTAPTASGARESFTNANWALVESDPDAHKGATVVLTGKVFSVERDQNGTYLQMWADADNSEQNTVVAVADPTLAVNEQDLVKVRGTVKGRFSGQNAFGASVSAAVVLASSVTKVSALALRSASITWARGQAWNYRGISIQPWRVEWAADETRVFLKVVNNSGAALNVFASSAHLIAGGRQYDAAFSIRDYPQLADDIQPGASSSGVIVFPAMDASAAVTKLTIEANSDDSNIGDYGSLSATWTWTR